MFPGGGSDLDNTTLFQAGKLFYDWSIEAYDNGGNFRSFFVVFLCEIHLDFFADIFPVIGHCLGFEMLAMITSDDFNILQVFFNVVHRRL